MFLSFYVGIAVRVALSVNSRVIGLEYQEDSV